MRMRRSATVLGVAVPIALAGFWIMRDLMRPAPDPLAVPAETVILLVLDGVRPDELLSGPDPKLLDDVPTGTVMPYLMDELMARGTFLGTDEGAAGFRLGNPMGVSMPSYQSIFTGRLTVCLHNSCAPAWGGSLLADIKQGFEGVSDAIGFFSSSGQICAGVGVKHSDQNVLCGPLKGPDLPDAEVFAAALEHLGKARPRFLYIALGESDHIGHTNDYGRYLDVLRSYDAFLRQLDVSVGELAAAGQRVTLLVTTDHGRGEGAEWTGHRWNIPGTERLWFFATGHGIAAAGHVPDKNEGSLYDIRATVNHLLGFTPPKGPLQGRVMTRILNTPSGETDSQ